jgi:GT2 family glycosyltransferase
VTGDGKPTDPRSLARALRERLAIVETSKFWRLRNAWFSLKRRLGIDSTGPLPPLDFDLSLGVAVDDAYDAWLAANDPRPRDLVLLRDALARTTGLPVISVIVPVHDPVEAHLRAALESVREQIYAGWELCIADDGSRAAHVAALLDEYARDPRVRVVRRPQAGGISAATNAALALAGGEFVAFLDHDDVLAPDALAVVALRAAGGDCDVLYSDEDKIDDAGRRFDAYFKPEWSPHTLTSRMYLGHLFVVRRTLVAEAGGLRSEYDGSQDHDLALRVTERTGRIAHLPHVLYHWRRHSGSTASGTGVKSYASEAGRRAVADAMSRRGLDASVLPGPEPAGTYVVRFAPPPSADVDVIVPTRDNGADLERCVSAVRRAARGVRPHVTIVDNGTVDPASLAVVARLGARPDVTVLRVDEPFNYSRLNNLAVAATRSPYVLLLNDDVELRGEDDLAALVEYAQQPEVGAVGARLLYPDGSLQHAGVVVGLGGIAGHPFREASADEHGYFRSVDAVTDVGAVTGACLMTRRGVYEEVGGLDESLAVAFNDVDFCIRVRATGRYVVYLPHVRATHAESKTRGSDDTPEKVARFAAEIAGMRARHGGEIERDPFYSAHLALDRFDCSPRVVR